MRVQLAWTALTEMLIMISGVLLLKLAASLLGAEGFGEYTLSRRAIGFMYLPLVMGLGIAAPRYIAIARSGALDGYSEGSFALATVTAGLLPLMAVAILLNVAPSMSSRILFGNDDLVRLIPGIALALAGIAMHAMVYAVYRGRSDMGLANALQLLNLGLVPVAAFFFSEGGAARVLEVTGSAWILFSAFGLIHIVFNERRERAAALPVLDHLRLMLRFGLPRVPGEFALVGLFAIPSLIAVRANGVVAAGHFSAAISVLTLVAAAFAPVGLVVLPRASAQAATGDIDALRRMVMRILGGGILLTAVVVVIGELLLPMAVRWYFGPEFVTAIPVFRACLLGALPYVIYVLMRNILDALDVKAVNSRNLIVTLVLLLILCLIRQDIMWMAISLVGALTLLGALTLRDTHARLRAPVVSPAAMPA